MSEKTARVTSAHAADFVRRADGAIALHRAEEVTAIRGTAGRHDHTDLAELVRPVR